MHKFRLRLRGRRLIARLGEFRPSEGGLFDRVQQGVKGITGRLKGKAKADALSAHRRRLNLADIGIEFAGEKTEGRGGKGKPKSKDVISILPDAPDARVCGKGVKGRGRIGGLWFLLRGEFQHVLNFDRVRVIVHD